MLANLVFRYVAHRMHIPSRVGISTVKGAEHIALPADIDTFLSSWNLEERKPTHVSGEFPTNSSMGEEVREKHLLEAAFVMGSAVKPNEDALPDRQYFVGASLKVSTARLFAK